MSNAWYRWCVAGGIGFLVAGTAVARTNTAGGVSAGPSFALAAPQYGVQRAPAVAAAGTASCLAVWQEGWPGIGGRCLIRAVPLRERKPGNAFLVSPDAGIHENPAVAVSGDGTALVVWQELTGGRQYDIKAQVVAADGRRIGAVRDIAAGPHNDVLPGVASDGKGFLVVWQMYAAESGRYAPYARLVAADGTPAGQAPMRLAGAGSSPRCVFDGENYLVLVEQGGGIHARRITRDGRCLDASDEGIKLPGLMTKRPAAASSGRETMVLGHAANLGPNPWGWGGPACVVAARVTRGGETPERAIYKPFSQHDVADGNVPGVLDASTWKGARGWPAGAPGGFKGTANGLWPTGPSAVTWVGGGYLAVWPRLHLERGYGCDLWAVPVGHDPVKALGEAVPVAGEPDSEVRPAVAPTGDRECVLVYESVSPDGKVAVLGRWLNVNP